MVKEKKRKKEKVKAENKKVSTKSPMTIHQ